MHCKATKVLGSRMQHGNANEMLGLSDAMKTTRSPQRRARRKGNKMLGRSDATKTTRSPQQRAHCRATKVSAHGLQSRQCAAHSGVRTAEQRNSWVCATKATRSPQRRTRRIATKFIDPSLPRDAILSLYWFYWLRTLYVIQWQYVTCYTATLTNEISVAARYTSWRNEFRSIMRTHA